MWDDENFVSQNDETKKILFSTDDVLAAPAFYVYLLLFTLSLFFSFHIKNTDQVSPAAPSFRIPKKCSEKKVIKEHKENSKPVMILSSRLWFLRNRAAFLCIAFVAVSLFLVLLLSNRTALFFLSVRVSVIIKAPILNCHRLFTTHIHTHILIYVLKDRRAREQDGDWEWIWKWR